MLLNLKTANQLIREIANQNPYLSPIKNDDFALFKKFFQKEPPSYGNSWTYIIQGMYGIGPNNLGYKYFDGKNLSAVTVYPKIEQPKINVFYWIRPMGNQILEIIEEFSKKTLKPKKIYTYVKKIFKNQYQFLIKKGFKPTITFPWHSSCHSEDDTYPELIFDTKKTLTILKTPPRTTNIRKSYRKAMQIEKKNKVVFSKVNFQKMAWKLTKDFFDSTAIQQKKINISTEYDYYNPIFNKVDSKTIIKNIIYVNNVPLGYYILEKQNSLYSSLYALIVLRDKIKYLSDYMIFSLLKSSQTKYLNIGGSEDKGLHNFKKKFKPAFENQMYWVYY